MEQQLTETTVQSLLDLGASLMGVRGLADNGKPFVIVPQGYKVEDIEKLLPRPVTKRAEVTLTEADSFIFYTKKHGSLDECVIYADVDYAAYSCRLIGLINDHGADTPSWRNHQAAFSPRLTVEWDRWIRANRKTMSQTDFGVFLEENLPDIATVQGMPTGAEILQMALAFEATSDKRFRSKTNLQSGGYSIEFVDEENNDTRETMKVFERFTIGIPVFEGSANAYPIEARLKYRESSGKLAFWYELIRQDRVFKTAVMAELDRIKEATGFPIVFGVSK